MKFKHDLLTTISQINCNPYKTKLIITCTFERLNSVYNGNN